MEQRDQNISDRKAVHAGRFYAATKDSLNKELDRLFTAAGKNIITPGLRALISPHAGYLYSGEVAAKAYNLIDPKANWANVFILATSHTERFKGAAVYADGDFLSPLGKASVNKEIARNLINTESLFINYNQAHFKEHSIEVQIPFLQRIFGDKLSIVPIVIGTDNFNELSTIATSLQSYFTGENLFVVSSDFSHYPNYKDAIEIDASTLEMFINSEAKDFSLWLQTNNSLQSKNVLTRMCGCSSGIVLKLLSEQDNMLEYKHIAYSNSGDVQNGDHSSVVGYHAISLVVKEESDHSFILTDSDKMQLLAIARKAIEARLEGGKIDKQEPEQISASLKVKAGAFVSLKKGKKLRGCIGSLNATDLLYNTVSQMAVSAAFSDYRFDPLTKKEYEKVSIEISVLTPMKKVNSFEDIIVGKHGVMIKFENRSATFLPQVASEQGWNREQLLAYLSEKKAGLKWDSWKSADIYIYEAIVIDESKN